MVDDWGNARLDHVAHPKRSKTESGNGNDEADDGETLVPRGIGELEVVLIGASAVKDFADKTQDIDCCDDDAGHGGDGQEAVEAIYILEGTDEDGHFCNEA